MAHSALCRDQARRCDRAGGARSSGRQGNARQSTPKPYQYDLHLRYGRNVTPAYLFRKVGSEDGRPTILYDEIDTVFGPKAKDNEELRGLLNAGHRQGAVAGRCVVHGKTVMTEEIPAYAAVAMAGLGWLPDTIMTRSVIIRMRRRKPGENVEPYRRRLHAHDGDRIRAQLEVWAGEQGEINWPDLGEIQDRDADVWEALVAVAELAGGDWPARARAAAAALIAVGKDAERSLGLRLLADIKVVFDASYTATISSADLANKLAALEEAPWGDLRGKPLDQRGLAKRLKEYGIKPKMIRGIGGVRGYDAADFTDAWDRYLPPSPGKTATTATSATTHVLGAPNVAVADAVADGVQRVAPQAREKANENGPVAHVAVVADLRTNGKASRACVQCGADDGMTVAQSSDGNTVFLHRECMRFWVRERNEAARATQ